MDCLFNYFEAIINKLYPIILYIIPHNYADIILFDLNYALIEA